MCSLFAFQISKSRTPILKSYAVFTPDLPSDFWHRWILRYQRMWLRYIYELFEYLRAELLFQKFTLVSILSHPLILPSPIFAISKNVIALHLCAFRISNSRTAIFKKFPISTPESPSDFDIASFCNINHFWNSGSALRYSRSTYKAYKCSAITFVDSAKIGDAKIIGWLRGENRVNF